MINKNLFPAQEGEEIQLVIREHWFYLFMRLLGCAIFVVILFALDKYLPILFPNILSDPFASYYSLFKNIYAVFLTLGLFMIWTLYYLNIEVITSHRIVDVLQRGLFNHTVSELDISKIEDVTGETTGFFGTIFSFGNVRVQTAGKEEHFVFYNIPHPDKVEKLILDLYQKTRPQNQQE